MKAVLGDVGVPHSEIRADLIVGTDALLRQVAAQGFPEGVARALRMLNPDFVHFHCETVQKVIREFSLDESQVYSCMLSAKFLED